MTDYTDLLNEERISAYNRNLFKTFTNDARQKREEVKQLLKETQVVVQVQPEVEKRKRERSLRRTITDTLSRLRPMDSLSTKEVQKNQKSLKSRILGFLKEKKIKTEFKLRGNKGERKIHGEKKKERLTDRRVLNLDKERSQENKSFREHKQKYYNRQEESRIDDTVPLNPYLKKVSNVLDKNGNIVTDRNRSVAKISVKPKTPPPLIIGPIDTTLGDTKRERFPSRNDPIIKDSNYIPKYFSRDNLKSRYNNTSKEYTRSYTPPLDESLISLMLKRGKPGTKEATLAAKSLETKKTIQSNSSSEYDDEDLLFIPYDEKTLPRENAKGYKQYGRANVIEKNLGGNLKKAVKIKDRTQDFDAELEMVKIVYEYYPLLQPSPNEREIELELELEAWKKIESRNPSPPPFHYIQIEGFNEITEEFSQISVNKKPHGNTNEEPEPEPTVGDNGPLIKQSIRKDMSFDFESRDVKELKIEECNESKNAKSKVVEHKIKKLLQSIREYDKTRAHVPNVKPKSPEIVLISDDESEPENRQRSGYQNGYGYSTEHQDISRKPLSGLEVVKCLISIRDQNEKETGSMQNDRNVSTEPKSLKRLATESSSPQNIVIDSEVEDLEIIDLDADVIETKTLETKEPNESHITSEHEVAENLLLIRENYDWETIQKDRDEQCSEIIPEPKSSERPMESCSPQNMDLDSDFEDLEIIDVDADLIETKTLETKEPTESHITLEHEVAENLLLIRENYEWETIKNDRDEQCPELIPANLESIDRMDDHVVNTMEEHTQEKYLERTKPTTQLSPSHQLRNEGVFEKNVTEAKPGNLNETSVIPPTDEIVNDFDIPDELNQRPEKRRSRRNTAEATPIFIFNDYKRIPEYSRKEEKAIDSDLRNTETLETEHYLNENLSKFNMKARFWPKTPTPQDRDSDASETINNKISREISKISERRKSVTNAPEVPPTSIFYVHKHPEVKGKILESDIRGVKRKLPPDPKLNNEYKTLPVTTPSSQDEELKDFGISDVSEQRPVKRKYERKSANVLPVFIFNSYKTIPKRCKETTSHSGLRNIKTLKSEQCSNAQHVINETRAGLGPKYPPPSQHSDNVDRSTRRSIEASVKSILVKDKKTSESRKSNTNSVDVQFSILDFNEYSKEKERRFKSDLNALTLENVKSQVGVVDNEYMKAHTKKWCIEQQRTRIKDHLYPLDQSVNERAFEKNVNDANMNNIYKETPAAMELKEPPPIEELKDFEIYDKLEQRPKKRRFRRNLAEVPPIYIFHRYKPVSIVEETNIDCGLRNIKMLETEQYSDGNEMSERTSQDTDDYLTEISDKISDEEVPPPSIYDFHKRSRKKEKIFETENVKSQEQLVDKVEYITKRGKKRKYVANVGKVNVTSPSKTEPKITPADDKGTSDLKILDEKSQRPKKRKSKKTIMVFHYYEPICEQFKTEEMDDSSVKSKMLALDQCSTVKLSVIKMGPEVEEKISAPHVKDDGLSDISDDEFKSEVSETSEGKKSHKNTVEEPQPQ